MEGINSLNPGWKLKTGKQPREEDRRQGTIGQFIYHLLYDWHGASVYNSRGNNLVIWKVEHNQT